MGEVTVPGVGSISYRTDDQDGRIALVDIRGRQLQFDAATRVAMCAPLFKDGIKAVLIRGGKYPAVILGAGVQMGIAISPSARMKPERLATVLSTHNISAGCRGSEVIIDKCREGDALIRIRGLLRIGEM